VFRREHWIILQHLKHRVIESNERERWLKVCNLSGGTSEVRAKSADQPVSLLGEGLDWLIVDEAAHLQRFVWEEALAPRLVDKLGWALLLSTPQGCNWFFRSYRLGQKKRDPDYESWSSPSWVNPHLSAEAIEAERSRLSPASFAQEFGAVFVGAEAEPCDACGWPRLNAPGVLIVRNDEAVRTCGECRHPIDFVGRSLVKKVPGYEPRMSVIRLRTHLGHEPALPLKIQALIDEKAAVVESPQDYEDPLPVVETDQDYDDDNGEPISQADLERILQIELNS
jgi:hypothetical protein